MLAHCTAASAKSVAHHWINASGSWRVVDLTTPLRVAVGLAEVPLENGSRAHEHKGVFSPLLLTFLDADCKHVHLFLCSVVRFLPKIALDIDLLLKELL